VIVPEVDAAEVALFSDITVIPAPTLNALYDHLSWMNPLALAAQPDLHPDEVLVETDFSEIERQEYIRRTNETGLVDNNGLMIGLPENETT
jgi:predicted ATPase with chaperone activity